MSAMLTGEARNKDGMSLCQEMMQEIFKDTIVLVKLWRPVQMCVFYQSL